MLEIAIIVVLALVLFLLLKNFPRTKELVLTDPDLSDKKDLELKPKKKSFLAKFFNKKKIESEKDIEKAIVKNQEKIIAPSEINEAHKRYKTKNLEIAKMLHEATISLQNNDLRSTEDVAIDVIGRDKKCSYAYILIGKVALNRGVLDDAKESFNTAIKCDPEQGDAYFNLGLIDIKDENYTQAINNFQRAVSLNRGVAEWYGELGKAYIEIRQFSKAAKALKRAASLDIDNNEYKRLAIEAEEKQKAHSTVFRNK